MNQHIAIFVIEKLEVDPTQLQILHKTQTQTHVKCIKHQNMSTDTDCGGEMLILLLVYGIY